MALCIARFAAKKQLTSYFRGIYLPSSRLVGLKAVPAEPPRKESFDERNARLQRPQSPHLTIYKFQLTSMLSITHRATGMVLGGYMTILGLGGLAGADFPHIAEMIENLHLPSLLIFTGKAILAYPFAYHLINGVRHLMWDTGKFLTIKEVYSTGYAMLIASSLFSLFLAYL